MKHFDGNDLLVCIQYNRHETSSVPANIVFDYASSPTFRVISSDHLTLSNLLSHLSTMNEYYVHFIHARDSINDLDNVTKLMCSINVQPRCFIHYRAMSSQMVLFDFIAQQNHIKIAWLHEDRFHDAREVAEYSVKKLQKMKKGNAGVLKANEDKPVTPVEEITPLRKLSEEEFFELTGITDPELYDVYRHEHRAVKRLIIVRNIEKANEKLEEEL